MDWFASVVLFVGGSVLVSTMVYLFLGLVGVQF